MSKLLVIIFLSCMSLSHAKNIVEIHNSDILTLKCYEGNNQIFGMKDGVVNYLYFLNGNVKYRFSSFTDLCSDQSSFCGTVNDGRYILASFSYDSDLNIFYVSKGNGNIGTTSTYFENVECEL